RHAPSQDVERLDERHTRLQQRREFLVEDEEFPGGNSSPARQLGDMEPSQRTAARLLNPEDVQTFILELAPQPSLVVGDVDAFDDLAARRAEATPELHT